jgi:eukaryotic-like serine/threonine-protein kinase
MPLSSGTKFGPYEILSKIGAGGMGEVYRARDTRLERTVAIKVLPSEFSRHAELCKRLEREARMLSSLTHPHICSLYDVGQQDGANFLVMEYLEGETLGQRLLKGALPAGQVLQYGIEIADALERAHRHGIIHRDLKPGNIMLTKDGAKLLDFGLARVEATAAPSNETLPLLETQDHKLTEKGVVLGTFQYMAPEQLEGKEADARTDIFALGAVIYEMATGKAAFSGNNRTSLITAILASEPPTMTSLQPLAPPALERVVKTCMAKDPDSRWQSAQDLKLQLEWIAEGGSQAGLPAPVAARRRSRERIAWTLVALLTVAAVALGIGFLKRAPKSPPRVTFAINPPEQHSFDIGDGFLCCDAISPDGNQLALLTGDSEGNTSLWLRPFDSVSARELPGTEGVERVVWSGNGRFLLFIAGGKLKRIDAMGGLPDTLCDAKEMELGSWSSSGTVLNFSPVQAGPIRQLNLDDCSNKPVTKLDSARYDFGHRWPNFLPDGKHFLFAGLRSDKKHDVLLGTLGSEVSDILVHNASYPKYAPPGYLFFERNGYLFVQPLSPSNLRLTGDPVQVVPQQLLYAGLGGIANYDVSDNGVLSYRAQGEVRSKLVLRDSTGTQLEALGESPKPGESSTWSGVRVAPNRKKLLASKDNNQTHMADLWTYDLQHKDWQRFSSESTIANDVGVWSPDGQTIVYAAVSAGNFKLYRRLADRSRDAELLPESKLNQFPTDWSLDGRFLLYEQSEGTAETGDLWAMPMEGNRKPFPLTQTRFDEREGRFSPDGHWIAYRSDESGKREIYIRSFPGPSGKWRISSGGGQYPRWSDDGKNIYYLTLDWKLMVVPVTMGATVQVGAPRFLFSLSKDSEFEVLAEGKFLVNEPVGQLFGLQTVVLNWDATLGFNK